MAIVIKVKADTRELEQDIEAAARRVQSKLGGSGGGGFNIAGASARLFGGAQNELSALTSKVAAANTATAAANVTFAATIAGITGIGLAAIGASKAILDMGKAGSQAAKGILELSVASGKTVEQIQALKIGSKDFTTQLSLLGAVLDEKVIKTAARAFDQFEVLDAQWQAFTIETAAGMAKGLDDLGVSFQNALRAASGKSLGESLGAGFSTAAQDINATTRELQFLKSLIDFISPSENFARLLEGISRLRGAGVTGQAPVQEFRGFPPPLPDAAGIPFATPGALEWQLSGRGRSPALPRARRARAVKEKLSPAVQGRLDEQAFFFDSIFGQDEFQLTALIDKTDKNIQKLNAQLKVLADEGLSKSAKATELMNQQLVEQNNLVNALDNRYAKLQNTLTGLSEVDKALLLGRGAQLVVPGAPPIAQGAGIPGITTPGAIEARGPIAQAQRDEARRLFDEVTQRAIEFKQTIVFTFESAFREGFERGPKAFLNATLGAIKGFFSQLAAELSTGIIEMLLFGKGGVSGRGVGTTGVLGGLRASLGGFGGTGGGGGGGGGGGFGGLLGGLFGGGGSSGSAGIGVPGSISGGGAIPGSIRLAAGGGGFPILTGGSAAVGGAAGFSFLGAAAGPALLGGLLGTGLGGKSTAGKILGGIGGGIAGIGVGLGAAVGLAGGGLLAGALAATGFGLLAAPFIVGAILLGKAKQRRNDEQLADSIWVSEREQVRQLISAVNADRIDGASALAQASALRAETVSQLNQIKTKSVRDSRLSNQLRDLDNTVIAELRAAVERQGRRQGNAGFLLPEFGSGGVVPGIDTGRDSVLARVQPGEIILNKAQQRRIQERLGPNAFAEIGVPRQRFQYGGVVQREHSPGSTEVTLVFQGDAAAIAGSLIVRGVNTSSGQRAIVNVIKSSRRNGDL